MPTQEIVEDKKAFPVAAAVTAGLIAAANLHDDNRVVRTLTNVRPTSSWSEWAYRWPGSFFKASPLAGKLLDTVLSVGLLGGTLAHTEREEGAKRALKIAAVGHVLGSAATRTAAVIGLVPAGQMHDLDVGSSSATAALAGNWATRLLREHFSTPKARILAMGAGASVMVALGFVDPSVTDIMAHAGPYAYGVWEGGRRPVESSEPVPGETAATLPDGVRA